MDECRYMMVSASVEKANSEKSATPPLMNVEPCLVSAEKFHSPPMKCCIEPDLISGIQPHLREQQQELELQAVKLQTTGKYVFGALILVSLILTCPALIAVLAVCEPLVIYSLFMVSSLTCLGILTCYAYLTYRFRDTPPLRARGTRFLLYIYISLFSSQISSCIVTFLILVSYVSYQTLYDSIRWPCAIIAPVVLLSDAMFFGSLCGRLRVLSKLFTGPPRVYSRKVIFRIFHLPFAVLVVVGGAVSIPVTVSLLMAHFGLGRSLRWFYFGYVAVSVASLSLLCYYTRRTRHVSKRFSDRSQNVRTVVVYCLFSLMINVVVLFTNVRPSTQLVLQQVCHQIVLLVFVMDSFSATFLHLWRQESVHPIPTPAGSPVVEEAIIPATVQGGDC